jgi:hypothetical protein
MGMVTPKPIATWTPGIVRGWAVSKGTLVDGEGKLLADRITLGGARARFKQYRIRDASRRTDPLDYRLPGSYGSRQ